MAEERTMSTITNLNSPDQAAQKVTTLINTATIRQYYKRDEAPKCSSARSLHPTVRFADLTLAAQILTPDYDEVQAEVQTSMGLTRLAINRRPLGIEITLKWSALKAFS